LSIKRNQAGRRPTTANDLSPRGVWSTAQHACTVYVNVSDDRKRRLVSGIHLTDTAGARPRSVLNISAASLFRRGVGKAASDFPQNECLMCSRRS